MDVLSEALERIEYRAGVPGTAQLHAPWGFFHPLPGQPVPTTDGLPEELVEFLPLTRPSFGFFYIVAEGHCPLKLTGAEPVELSSGDLVMLTPLAEHQVTDSASTLARPLFDYIPVTSM